jgi:hypothetical protein
MRYLLACAGVFGLVGFAACGDDTAAAEDELETACNAFCDKVYGGDCPTPNITLDQCRQSCAYAKAQLAGYCVAEYTAVFDCTSKGDVTCTDNGPIPTATCVEENTALTECASKAACERWCDTATSAGCPPGGTTAACVADCNSKKEGLGVCASQYDFYLQCGYTIGLACEAGRPVSQDCDDNLTGVGGCLASFIDPCTGYCFSAEALGCAEGEACKTACIAERDQVPTCSETYESWLECVADGPDPTCGANGLESSFCDSERQSFDSCIAG